MMSSSRALVRLIYADHDEYKTSDCNLGLNIADVFYLRLICKCERMLLKVAFAVVFLVAAARAFVVDDNAIATHVLDNYFSIVNASGKYCKCILTHRVCKICSSCVSV